VGELVEFIDFGGCFVADLMGEVKKEGKKEVYHDSWVSTFST
jgi:hypothetical protein